MKAKTLWVVFASCALLVSAVRSQAQPRWQFGLKAGANTASLSGDQAGLWLSGPDFQVSAALLDRRAGFIGGGYARYQVGPRFALQLDALWSRKGGKGNVFGHANILAENNIVYNAEINGEMSLALDYVEFPLIAVLTLPSAEGVAFNPYAGVSFGIPARADARLSGEAEVILQDGSPRRVTFDQAYNVRSSVRDTEGQLVLGAMVEWDTKHGRFVLDGRYSLSLRTIDDSQEKTIRNNVLSLMAGFAWGKGEPVE
jgi:hypothetical protein